MATEAEMGEIEEMHSKEEVAGDQILNGDISDIENGNEDSQSSIKKGQTTDTESMEVDEQAESPDNTNKDEEDEEKGEDEKTDDNTEPEADEGDTEKEEGEMEKDDDGDSVKSGDSDCKTSEKEHEITNGRKSADEVHEIIDDDDEMDGTNGLEKGDELIELNDSGEGEGDGDVMIIDEPKENGSLDKRRHSDELEVIELDTSPIKKHKELTILAPRRSARNINKNKSFVESDKEDEHSGGSSEESDIEEVLPQDPLAMGNDRHEVKRTKHTNSNSSSTIVVKDTKRLVEIAAKSNSNNSGNKKEPTLVIIDTNSILSGRGPVPVNNKSSSSSSAVNQSYPTLLPMALPAQGMYPPNMRATITPIPLNSSATATPPPPPLTKAPSSSTACINPAALAPVLPTLTDDMFVVEAPSFIVPYVYEKPPVSDFKNFLKEVANKLIDDDENNKDEKDSKKDDKVEDEEKDDKDDDLIDNLKNKSSYFESPLGKFFIDIGFNLVQEFVQADMLRQQKKKRDREGGQNPATNKTIHSLMKNLEFTKENNEPFKTPMKKCEFCHFKSESNLVMAHHLETPHTKNYVYKCNFCTYEARSPHDILFHMEAEHAVRGRLERAPSFHQCPNCPFEDNQKGKLSRHLVACMRKFKPEKNLEPPIDWEPPAKIPRVPKARQGLNVSAYQAMKSSQLQFLSKMQLLNTNSSSQALHRGRGRPSLGAPMKQTLIRPSGMVYKQTMSGGSVLVPTNYQLSGNQVYQVVGGQELGGRLGHPGQMAFVPNIPSASSTVTIQNQAKNKSVHQPSISITPLPRAAASPNSNIQSKPGDTNSKNSFVICEICDGYIKDLEQLRNHMQWIHKVKIHPKMIYNRPPLNCQKCQFRFFTDQGLERHLLGSHGLVTSSMQDAANKSKDAGRCPVCGRVYQWKLLNHVARDHNMTLKPAHLSYKCTVCTATFGMYKQFENHVYSAHSVVAKRVMDKKNSSASSKNDQIMKPLKINDEITIIPQPAKAATTTSKEGSPLSSTGSRNSTPSTSKSR